MTHNEKEDTENHAATVFESFGWRLLMTGTKPDCLKCAHEIEVQQQLRSWTVAPLDLARNQWGLYL